MQLAEKETEGLCKNEVLISQLNRHLRKDNDEKKSKSIFVLMQEFWDTTVVSALIATVGTVVFAYFFEHSLAPWLPSVLAPTFCTFFAVAFLMISSGKDASKFIQRQRQREKKKDSIFSGASGKSVLFFAVLVPALISIPASIAACCYWTYSSIQVVASIFVPLGTLLAWQEIRAKAASIPVIRRIALGASVIYQCLLLNSVSHYSLEYGVLWALLPQITLLVFSLWLSIKLFAVQKEIPKRRIWPALACFGALALLPAIPDLLTNLSIFCVNSDEPLLHISTQTASSKKKLTDTITSILEGRIQPPLFSLLMPKSAYEEAYYRLTGAAFTGNGDNIPGGDAYYASSCLGTTVKTLSVYRSDLKADVNSETLSASFDWSLDFRTDSPIGKEARLQIVLPKNTAVTGLKLFPLDGSAAAGSVTAASAIFAGKQELLRQYSEQAIKQKDPVIATMIGADELMLQCAPILPWQPLRVELQCVSPLAPGIGDSASIQLPYVSASNTGSFADSQVTFKSDKRLRSKDGSFISNGRSITVEATDSAQTFRVSARSKQSRKFNFLNSQGRETQVERSLVRGEFAPRKLVLAIDGSADSAKYKINLMQLVKKLPKGMICNVLFASPEKGLLELNVNSASEALSRQQFSGGDRNWTLLQKAIVLAKQSDAHVLWIHGAKPGFAKRDITGAIDFNYCPIDIAGLCAKSVKIYNLQTEPGGNEIVERIHSSGGDLSSIVDLHRQGSLEQDLAAIIESSTSQGESAKLKFQFAEAPTAGDKFISGKAKNDLIALSDETFVSELIAKGKRSEAESYANSHHLLSPYTAAYCAPSRAIAAPTPAATPTSASTAPAFTGTIGPQGQDATLIQGVNTAGTVRVSNLANLEALLNIFANGAEILGLCWGVPMLIVGLTKLRVPGGFNRVSLGFSLIFFGLATPGCINWFVASSRDANIFS